MALLDHSEVEERDAAEPMGEKNLAPDLAALEGVVVPSTRLRRSKRVATVAD
jgi:hypothetical protein